MVHCVFIVFAYMCFHACTHIDPLYSYHVRVHIQLHVHVHVNIQLHVHVHVYIQVHVHVHVNIQVHVHVSIQLRVHWVEYTVTGTLGACTCTIYITTKTHFHCENLKNACDNYCYTYSIAPSHFISLIHTHLQVSSEVVDQASSGHLSQQTAATSHPPLPPSSSEHPQLEVSFWQEVTDPNTNHVYYWNPETNEVSWTLPANGVISNEVAGGTEMETENSAGGMEGGASAAQGDPVKNAATASGTISVSNSSSVKTKKKDEVDIFASAIDESNSTTMPGPSTKPVDQPTVVQDEGATEESISSSKKRKASPQPRVMETANEPLGDVVEAFPSTKRQRLIAPGSSVSSGVALGGTSEDGSGSKQAEQMLRVS